MPALEAILHSNHQLIAVLTQPDRKSGRGRKISKSHVKQSVTSPNVLILQPENVNDTSLISQLSALNLDLLVVAAYGQIFSQQLLDLPKLGCINIHASLLPKWRGASPIQHAILEGDQMSGVSIIQMQRQMDAGDIWLQSECVISEQDTSQSLHDKLAKLSGQIINHAIQIVAEAKNKPASQDPLGVRYCAKLNKSDGLINWSEPAQLILRKIRAYHPWPGAFTLFNGRRIRITSAIEGEENQQNAQHGTILEVSKLGIGVATGEKTLHILELIPEGGKRVSAKDFSNSNTLQHQMFGEVSE